MSVRMPVRLEGLVRVLVSQSPLVNSGELTSNLSKRMVPPRDSAY